jgi:hypothetical protein
VTFQQVDGGPNYYATWPNAFPASATFLPIGVYPAESPPSSLATVGINFFTPMRNDQAGTWQPVWNASGGDGMTNVDAQPGFYAGGAFYTQSGSTPWGSRAAFDVYGDELDGNASNWFDVPAALSANNQAGSWGGLTASAYEAANAESHKLDPTRPTYIQTTGGIMDGGANYYYTLAQKQAICSSADLFSFDLYPVALRGDPVYSMADEVNEARGYCQDARPVYPFVETDYMGSGSVYPMPAQTVAEVWNAIIAGARGIQYFDMFGNIIDPTYTGGGRYAAGAMYDAIQSVDSEMASLATVINAPFAKGYVTATGNMSVMAKYYNGHFYIFAIPHAAGSQTVTFTVAGSPSAQATVLSEGRNLTVTDGHFTDTFADVNTVHIYEI